MIETALTTHLLSVAGVTDLCDAIFPQTIPDGQGPPAITYTFDDDLRDMLLEYTEGSLKMSRVEIRSWSDRYIEASQIATAIKLALVGHSGDFGTESPPAQVNHIRRESRSDLPFETDSRLYGVQQRFMIAYY